MKRKLVATLLVVTGVASINLFDVNSVVDKLHTQISAKAKEDMLVVDLNKESNSEFTSDTLAGVSVALDKSVKEGMRKEKVRTVSCASIDFGLTTVKKSCKSKAQKEAERLEREWQKELQYCRENSMPVMSGWENCHPDCLSYMSYTAVTSVNTPQYKLLRYEGHTDSNGLRMVGDRYCVALGSGYANKIGQKVDITLDDGTVFKAILGDQKSDRGTDETTHTYHKYHDGTGKPGDGSVVEFIVDMSVFNGVSSYPDWLRGRSIKSICLIKD